LTSAANAGRHRGEGCAERVGVERGERLTLRMPGVGDQLIECAEAREGLVDQVLGRAVFGEITEYRRAACAFRVALGGDIGETLAGGGVGATCVQHQCRARRGDAPMPEPAPVINTTRSGPVPLALLLSPALILRPRPLRRRVRRRAFRRGTQPAIRDARR
jgi:hypothetical protein